MNTTVTVTIETTSVMDKESVQVATEEIMTRINRLNTDEITPEQALAILKSYKSLL